MLTDLGLAARCAILSGNLQETVCINLKGSNELGLSTGHRRNAIELEFTKQTVVTALSPLTLVPLIQEMSYLRHTNEKGTHTGNVTVVWLSSTVVNVRDLLVGMGVFRGTTTPKISPCMATPNERGATSRRRRSAVLSEV